METKDGVGCGCLIAAVIFNLALGGWSVDYLLQLFAGKDIPFWADAIIGLIVGEVSIPLAIVCALLHYFGVF